MIKKQNLDLFSATYKNEDRRPHQSILNLIDYFDANSNKIETNSQQIIHYIENEERNVFILHKGSVGLYRSRDSMVLNSESSPFIFGFSNQISDPDYLFMRTQEPSTISYLPLSEANKIVEKNDLWKDLAFLLVYTAARVYEHCSSISQPTSYEIIKYQLLELMKESDEIRNNTTAAGYIKSRTFLSRSGIMRILSELKVGGYIQIERGVLTKIIHLPKKY
ncbi:helix-turn-helix domain-containing protein [Dryocola clanedunensis]